MADFTTRLERLQDEATKYIESVLQKRGTNYELCDPALYEDEYDDEIDHLPRANYFGDNQDVTEYAIVAVNISKGSIEFEGIDISDKDSDNIYTFDPFEVTVKCICEIADLVKSLED